MFLDKTNPELWNSIGRFSKDVTKSYRAAGISDRTAELVNLRVSQINGCAYCLDLHARKALEAGESLQRITLLRTWDECGGLFTEEECAALAIAEATTDLPIDRKSVV